MKKKVIIGLGITILLVLAIIGWISTPKNQSSTLPTLSPSPTPFQTSISTSIASQQDIVPQNNDYAIVYDPVYDSYIINIFSSSFDKVRQIAEQALLKKLNLTENAACSKIKVSIGSPRWANPAQPSYDTFSFCAK